MVYWFTVNDFQPHHQASHRIQNSEGFKIFLKYCKQRVSHLKEETFAGEKSRRIVKKFIVFHGCTITIKYYIMSRNEVTSDMNRDVSTDYCLSSPGDEVD